MTFGKFIRKQTKSHFFFNKFIEIHDLNNKKKEIKQIK